MIYHITTPSAYANARNAGIYIHPSLALEGFIHCSFIDQILGTVQKHFKGIDELLILVLDKDQLNHEVVVEDLHQKGKSYPHIYGAINLDAIVEVIEFFPNEEDSYILPDGVLKYEG